MAYIIGQAFGLLTIACSLVMPFLKRKWQLLCANMAINLLTILNLSLIGQFGSANFLCLVAIVQSAIALPRAEKRGEPGRPETALFTVLYVGFGFFGIFSAPGFVPELNYRNLLELLPIMGALAQMVSVFVPDEQTTRKWLLCNAVVWLIYSASVGSSVVFNDLLAVVSTSMALYKYRRRKPEHTSVS